MNVSFFFSVSALLGEMFMFFIFQVRALLAEMLGLKFKFEENFK